MTDSQRFLRDGEIRPADSLTVMDRYVPDGDGPWPVVVLLHGGTMDGHAMAGVAQAIAERGVIVYTPTYLHGMWDLGAEGVASGHWAGETLLGDLSCAIRAARADALEHGGAPEHLVLVGYSMGAGFGATVTLVGDDSDLAVGTSGSCVVSDGSVVPAAFVGWEGTYDWDAVVATEFPELLDLAPETIQTLGALGHVGRNFPDDPPPFHLRSGDMAFKGHYHSDFQASFDAALSAVGWPVTAEVLPDRYHTAFYQGLPFPEMTDLIVDVAYNPSG